MSRFIDLGDLDSWADSGADVPPSPPLVPTQKGETDDRLTKTRNAQKTNSQKRLQGTSRSGGITKKRNRTEKAEDDSRKVMYNHHNLQKRTLKSRSPVENTGIDTDTKTTTFSSSSRLSSGTLDDIHTIEIDDTYLSPKTTIARHAKKKAALNTKLPKTAKKLSVSDILAISHKKDSKKRTERKKKTAPKKYNTQKKETTKGTKPKAMQGYPIGPKRGTNVILFGDTLPVDSEVSDEMYKRTDGRNVKSHVSSDSTTAHFEDVGKTFRASDKGVPQQTLSTITEDIIGRIYQRHGGHAIVPSHYNIDDKDRDVVVTEMFHRESDKKTASSESMDSTSFATSCDELTSETECAKSIPLVLRQYFRQNASSSGAQSAIPLSRAKTDSERIQRGEPAVNTNVGKHLFSVPTPFRKVSIGMNGTVSSILKQKKAKSSSSGQIDTSFPLDTPTLNISHDPDISPEVKDKDFINLDQKLDESAMQRSEDEEDSDILIFDNHTGTGQSVKDLAKAMSSAIPYDQLTMDADGELAIDYLSQFHKFTSTVPAEQEGHQKQTEVSGSESRGSTEKCGSDEDVPPSSSSSAPQTKGTSFNLFGVGESIPQEKLAAAIAGQQYLLNIKSFNPEIQSIMESLKYKDNFGQNRSNMTEILRVFPNMSVRRRRDEEDHLRPPIGGERACAAGIACQGNFVDEINGFTLVEYPDPEAKFYYQQTGKWPKGSSPSLCVMCARANVAALYYTVMSYCLAYNSALLGQARHDVSFVVPQPGEESISATSRGSSDIGMHPSNTGRSGSSALANLLFLCKFTNLVGVNEYDARDCIMAASSENYLGLPGGIVIHSSKKYKYASIGGEQWYIQLYFKPECEAGYRFGPSGCLEKMDSSRYFSKTTADSDGEPLSARNGTCGQALEQKKSSSFSNRTFYTRDDQTKQTFSKYDGSGKYTEGVTEVRPPKTSIDCRSTQSTQGTVFARGAPIRWTGNCAIRENKWPISHFSASNTETSFKQIIDYGSTSVGPGMSLSIRSAGWGHEREPAVYRYVDFLFFGQKGLGSRIFSENNTAQRTKSIRTTFSYAKVIRQKHIGAIAHLFKKGYQLTMSEYITENGEKRMMALHTNIERDDKSISRFFAPIGHQFFVELVRTPIAPDKELVANLYKYLVQAKSIRSNRFVSSSQRMKKILPPLGPSKKEKVGAGNERKRKRADMKKSTEKSSAPTQEFPQIPAGHDKSGKSSGGFPGENIDAAYVARMVSQTIPPSDPFFDPITGNCLRSPDKMPGGQLKRIMYGTEEERIWLCARLKELDPETDWSCFFRVYDSLVEEILPSWLFISSPTYDLLAAKDFVGSFGINYDCFLYTIEMYTSNHPFMHHCDLSSDELSLWTTEDEKRRFMEWVGITPIYREWLGAISRVHRLEKIRRMLFECGKLARIKEENVKNSTLIESSRQKLSGERKKRTLGCSATDSSAQVKSSSPSFEHDVCPIVSKCPIQSIFSVVEDRADKISIMIIEAIDAPSDIIDDEKIFTPGSGKKASCSTKPKTLLTAQKRRQLIKRISERYPMRKTETKQRFVTEIYEEIVDKILPKEDSELQAQKRKQRLVRNKVDSHSMNYADTLSIDDNLPKDMRKLALILADIETQMSSKTDTVPGESKTKMAHEKIDFGTFLRIDRRKHWYEKCPLHFFRSGGLSYNTHGTKTGSHVPCPVCIYPPNDFENILCSPHMRQVRNWSTSTRDWSHSLFISEIDILLNEEAETIFLRASSALTMEGPCLNWTGEQNRIGCESAIPPVYDKDSGHFTPLAILVLQYKFQQSFHKYDINEFLTPPKSIELSKFKNLRDAFFGKLKTSITCLQDANQLFLIHVGDTFAHQNSFRSIKNMVYKPGLWSVFHQGQIPDTTSLHARLAYWKKFNDATDTDIRSNPFSKDLVKTENRRKNKKTSQRGRKRTRSEPSISFSILPNDKKVYSAEVSNMSNSAAKKLVRSEQTATKKGKSGTTTFPSCNVYDRMTGGKAFSGEWNLKEEMYATRKKTTRDDMWILHPPSKTYNFDEIVLNLRIPCTNNEADIGVYDPPVSSVIVTPGFVTEDTFRDPVITTLEILFNKVIFHPSKIHQIDVSLNELMTALLVCEETEYLRKGPFSTEEEAQKKLDEIYASTPRKASDTFLISAINTLFDQNRKEDSQEKVAKDLWFYFRVTKTCAKTVARHLCIHLNQMFLASFLGCYTPRSFSPSFATRAEIYRRYMYDVPSVKETQLWVAQHKHLLMCILRENHVVHTGYVPALHNTLHNLYRFGNIEKIITRSADNMRNRLQRDVCNIHCFISVFFRTKLYSGIMEKIYFAKFAPSSSRVPHQNINLWKMEQRRKLLVYLSRKHSTLKLILGSSNGDFVLHFCRMLETPYDVGFVFENDISFVFADSAKKHKQSLSQKEDDDRTSISYLLIKVYTLYIFFAMCAPYPEKLAKIFDIIGIQYETHRNASNVNEIYPLIKTKKHLKTLESLRTVMIHFWVTKDTCRQSSAIRKNKDYQETKRNCAQHGNDARLLLQLPKVVSKVAGTYTRKVGPKKAMASSIYNTSETKDISGDNERLFIDTSQADDVWGSGKRPATLRYAFVQWKRLGKIAKRAEEWLISQASKKKCSNDRHWSESGSQTCPCLFYAIEEVMQNISITWITNHIVRSANCVSLKKNISIWLLPPETFMYHAYVGCLVFSYRPRITSFEDEIITGSDAFFEIIRNPRSLENTMNMTPRNAEAVSNRFLEAEKVFFSRLKDIRATIHNVLQYLENHPTSSEKETDAETAETVIPKTVFPANGKLFSNATLASLSKRMVADERVTWSQSSPKIGLEWLVTFFDIRIESIYHLSKAREAMLSETNHRTPYNAVVHIAVHCPYDLLIIKEFFTIRKQRSQNIFFPLPKQIAEQQIQTFHRLYNAVPVGEKLPKVFSSFYFCPEHRKFCCHLVGRQETKTPSDNSFAVGTSFLSIDPVNDIRRCAHQTLKSGDSFQHKSDFDDLAFHCSADTQLFDYIADSSQAEEFPESIDEPKKLSELLQSEDKDLSIFAKKRFVVKCPTLSATPIEMIGKIFIPEGKEGYAICPYCVHITTVKPSKWTEIGLWCGVCVQGQEVLAKRRGLLWDKSANLPMNFNVPFRVGPYPFMWNPVDVRCVLCEGTASPNRLHRFVLMWNDIVPLTKSETTKGGRRMSRLCYMPICLSHARNYVGLCPSAMRLSNILYLNYRIESAENDDNQVLKYMFVPTVSHENFSEYTISKSLNVFDVMENHVLYHRAKKIVSYISKFAFKFDLESAATRRDHLEQLCSVDMRKEIQGVPETEIARLLMAEPVLAHTRFLQQLDSSFSLEYIGAQKMNSAYIAKTLISHEEDFLFGGFEKLLKQLIQLSEKYKEHYARTRKSAVTITPALPHEEFHPKSTIAKKTEQIPPSILEARRLVSQLPCNGPVPNSRESGLHKICSRKRKRLERLLCRKENLIDKSQDEE